MVKPILSTVELAHIPPELRVHVALYKDLKNARYLRKQLIDQNRDFEYAFIDARKILSTTHVLAAVFRSVNDMSNSRLKSHNVHSEIVLSLSTTNNIGDALRKFGMGEQTRNLLVIKVTPLGEEEVEAQLEQAVEAEPVAFDDEQLADVHDMSEIRKVYKLGATSTSKGKPPADGASDSAAERRDLEMAILGLMALRGAT